MKLQSPIYRFYEKRLWKQIKNGPKPHHIGVILDGNRRFALKKGLDAKEGHFFGAEKVEELLIWCLRFGIKIITLYVFSTENFNRTSAEVEKIMGLLVTKLQKINKDPLIVNNKVRVKIIGRRDDLSDNIIALINEIEEKTKDYDRHILNIALSYGGRAEIVDAVRKIATKVQEKEINITDIDEEIINDHLYTEGIPDPDLIIRTSGEERLSGFLLWQSAYSELYFTDIYWPAFRKIDLWRAIRIYQQRERRYGK
ncbi:MAG: di-trans,poly-cis-decaprenylcistransferase [Candidatus Heimdallarchaeota archaeon]|nr:MAG: di-trans,poly-cis-decaprenylcistransferase [Candidatus Heimdallarchaeota archaeon]